ncbi:site-specific DNA-methyltransferase [Marispirochaeta sp.]|uniref:site-specific DNA-methyltransferase n=1 Tax=Marispirochaeta sp. TaxID=2038653 RepID=UPI0029C8EC76|nr:site-specific DNA-methyltransferase [Marispirochaeta sp.]
MIYIDPPYNTGNDFVYDDDFAEPLQDYLKRTGQIDGEGSPLTTNKKADGRFHSKWLSMIYPRLRLARELLQEDGVIFVSIDDNEVHHLRMVMNEVFGEENYRNTISVRRGIKNVQAQFDDLSALSQGHEYIMVFSKYADTRLPKLFLSHGEQRPGKWDTFWRGTDRPTMRYELFGVNPERGQWRWEEHRTKNAIQNYVFYLNQIAGRMTLDEWYLDNLTATNTKLNFVRKNEEGVVQYYVPPTAGKL